MMTEWFEGYVQANDLNIHYHRTGGNQKPVLILLHGVMDNGLGWIPVARDLQERFDVIMTDARGHGKTGGSVEGFSYKLLAADLLALIQALNLEQPSLFGHSMGAMTAAQAAATAPGQVRALVLEDPPFMDVAQEVGEEMLQFFQSILALKNLSPTERLIAARKYNPLWDEVELGPWADSKGEFNPAVFQYMERLAPWREVLPHITCPLLLVTGDPAAHAIITPEIARETVKLCPQTAVIQIAGAGHCVHRDRYAETMPGIHEFLDRV